MSAPQWFIRRPEAFQAMQFDGSNAEAVAAWCGGRVESAACSGDGPPYWVRLDKPHGSTIIGRDDWVIRSQDGEFFPCHHNSFNALYQSIGGAS